MSKIQCILDRKGSQVFTVCASATVLEATRVMNHHHVGALVVLEDNHVIGMFTERDVLSRVVAADRSPSTTTVAEVMTREIMICTPETPIDQAGATMRDKRLRHLPVCESGGQLKGLVSIGDINAYHVREQEAHIEFLHDYVYGRS